MPRYFVTRVSLWACVHKSLMFCVQFMHADLAFYLRDFMHGLDSLLPWDMTARFIVAGLHGILAHAALANRTIFRPFVDGASDQ
jgi:hypothetical protein